MRSRSSVALAALALGGGGLECEEGCPCLLLPKTIEGWREALAHGAGVEALAAGKVKAVVPAEKEGDTLEVVIKTRVPKLAKVALGTFGGKLCLAWIGAVPRMVKAPVEGMPPTEELVKVVFVKPIRPTKAERLSYSRPAATPVVEG